MYEVKRRKFQQQVPSTVCNNSSHYKRTWKRILIWGACREDVISKSFSKCRHIYPSICLEVI